MTSNKLLESITTRDNVYKILSIIALWSITFAVVLLWNNPLLHYQLSPYSGIPAIAWALLFIAFFLAGYVLVSSQAGKTETANRWFLIGLLMVVLVSAVVLLFPYIRGAWFMDKGDSISHVALTGRILMFHHAYSYYPPLHILSANLVMITEISAYTAITSLGILFYLLYIVWTYCLAKVVLKDRSMIALAIIAAATFPLSRIAAIPWYLSLTILPLVISSYSTKYKSMSHSITCLILLSLSVFFHPLTGLILMFCLIGIELFQRLQGTLARQNTPRQLITIRAEYGAALFFSVVFLSWMVYLNIHLFAGNVGRLIEAITSSIQVTEHQWYVVDFPTLGIEGWGFVNLFLKMYGAHIIFLALTLIAIFLTYKMIRSGTALESEHKLFSLSGFIVVTGLVMLVALARPSVMYVNITRLTNPLTVMTPIFVAYALYHIYIHLKDKVIQRFRMFNGKIKGGLLLLPLIILTITFVIMTFMIYPSPYVKQSNLQLVEPEIAGATWLLEHTKLEKDIEGYDLGINWRLMEVSASLAGYFPAGYYPAGYHPAGYHPEHPYVYFRKLSKRLPDHMGYDSYDTMGDYFGAIKLPTATGFELLDDGYVVLTRERMIRALELYAPLGWLNQDDLGKFYNDSTVNRVYSNYEYSTFWVPPSH